MGKFDQLGHGEQMPIFAVADLPAAADCVGQLVWCSNGQAGAACMAQSNGTNWVYAHDNSTIVSAT